MEVWNLHTKLSSVLYAGNRSWLLVVFPRPKIIVVKYYVLHSPVKYEISSSGQGQPEHCHPYSGRLGAVVQLTLLSRCFMRVAFYSAHWSLSGCLDYHLIGVLVGHHLTLVLRLVASAELRLYRTSLPSLIVSRTIWFEWTRPRWSTFGLISMRQKSCCGVLWFFKRPLVSLLDKQRNPHCDVWFFIINIQANWVAIVSSVITKISNPCKYWTVTIQPIVKHSLIQSLFCLLPFYCLSVIHSVSFCSIQCFFWLIRCLIIQCLIIQYIFLF